MKKTMYFTKKCFMTFATTVTLLFAQPCFTANREFEHKLEQTLMRTNNTKDFVMFYNTHRAQFEKWLGTVGCCGVTAFFKTSTAPNKKFLLPFLAAGWCRNAGEHVRDYCSNN